MVKRKSQDIPDDPYYGIIPEDDSPSYFMQPLTVPLEKLNWPNSTVYYPYLTRFMTHHDSESSLVHTCLNAYYRPYREGRLHSLDVSQVELVAMFRNEMGLALYRPVANDTKRQYIHLISDGAWINSPSADPEQLYQQLINPAVPMDDLMVEHMCNVLNIDLYIIEADTQGLERNIPVIRYKRRNSVVVLRLRKHYELLGLHLPGNEHVTIFSHDHPWIQSLYNQLNLV